MPRPLDGAGEDAGEKADEQCVVHRVQNRLLPAAVHIEHIAQALEGEVGKAQRRRQVQGTGGDVAAEHPRKVGPELAEKAEVFVKKQNAPAAQKRQPQKGPAGPFVPKLFTAEGNAAAIGDHGGADKQHHQPGVLGLVHIKRIAGQQQKIGLCLPRETIGERGDSRKKAQKDQRIKIHTSTSCLFYAGALCRGDAAGARPHRAGTANARPFTRPFPPGPPAAAPKGAPAVPAWRSAG